MLSLSLEFQDLYKLSHPQEDALHIAMDLSNTR